jgi:hypothetical protein
VLENSERFYVLFKTHLFVSQPRDEKIDRWLVGADCAGWFYAQLSLVDRIDPYCEPVMEDWGWTFAVSVQSVRVWVNIWNFPIENCWLFAVNAKRRLFLGHTSQLLQAAKKTVCDGIESIIANDPRITKHQWFAANPFELKLTEF